MTYASLLLLIAAQAAAPVATAQTGPVLSQDWSQLPELRYRRTPDYPTTMTDYVREEVRAGRCAAPPGEEGARTLKVDMAVLVSASGPVERIVPRAINCPTVEQYASGLVSRAARDNVAAAGVEDAWYRTSVAFTWRE